MEASQTALNALKDKSGILQKQGKIVFLQTSKKSHALCHFQKSDRVGSAASLNKESLSSSLQAAESRSLIISPFHQQWRFLTALSEGARIRTNSMFPT